MTQKMVEVRIKGESEVFGPIEMVTQYQKDYRIEGAMILPIGKKTLGGRHSIAGFLFKDGKWWGLSQGWNCE
jgi:hypothetical protein